MSDRFTTYRSTFEAMKAFPAEDMKKAYVMIGEYALDGVLPEPEETVAYGLFLSVKPLIDTSAKRSSAGRNGGEANVSKVEANLSKVEANVSKPEAKIKDKRINIKETPTKVGVKKSGFTPPTLQEVQAYVSEKGFRVDAERFVDFYTSKGWMVGSNPMKDWKAAVRNWERSQRKETTAEGRQEKTVNRFNDFKQRNYDFKEIERKLRG